MHGWSARGRRHDSIEESLGGVCRIVDSKLETAEIESAEVGKLQFSKQEMSAETIRRASRLRFNIGVTDLAAGALSYIA